MPPEARVDAPRGFRPREDNVSTLGAATWSPTLGTRCNILGLRAQESLMRTRSVLKRQGADHYVTSRGDGYYTASPVFDWKAEDVWLAPRRLGWDYNRAYDRMDEAGISRTQQRCAPPFGEEPIGNLWMFKVCFPELWEKMHNRVPGAATAARYSKTALYAYGGMPEKPADVSWEEHIKRYVMKFDGEHRRAVAARVASEIRRHYGKTDEPILENVPHPETGISWRFLMKIAMRGNFKGRATAPVASHGAARETARARYDEARAEEQG
jgi:predicted phosphoadenosine phosphosulfate sulfurtransferase